ncbi:MAG TPA: hypothetical protein VIJ95_06115 [Hanamia sp.]
MNLNKYQLKAGQELLSYEFISEGPKGLIRKRIQFTLVNRNQVYNLAFGDKDPVSGEIDDLVVSNNSDSEKVLATVVGAVYAFCDRHPKAWIYASGSTSARTRLYKMGITKYYEEIKDDFDIFGQVGEDWETFEKGKDYIAFLAQQKTT